MRKEKDNEKNNPHEGHRARMKERFRRTGFDGFNEHQIMELLLYFGYQRKDTNELAHELIKKYGTIAGVMDAAYDDLTTYGKLCDGAAIVMKLIPQCLPVYYNSKYNGKTYDDIDMLKELFVPFFVGLDHEEFRLACFDSELRVLSNVLIASGGPSRAAGDMRHIVESALNTKAACVAIAHNHPNGSSEPSQEDESATRLIGTTLKAMGITLVDHIIVGRSSTLSFRGTGYLGVFD